MMYDEIMGKLGMTLLAIAGVRRGRSYEKAETHPRREQNREADGLQCGKLLPGQA